MPLVLTISTGIEVVTLSRDSARVAWKPFMPGSTTSMSTRSGSSRLQTSMPSSALVDASTWWPLRSSNWVSTAVSVGESSINRMRAICCLSPRSGVDVLADRVEEFLAREWFGDVLLGADDAAAGLVEQPVLGRQHDDRRALEHLVVLDQRAGLITVQARHHDVDEDDLRPLIGDLGQSLEAVGRGHDFGALALEQGFRGAADGFRIIDHHHAQPVEAAGARFVLRHCVSPVRDASCLPASLQAVLYPSPAQQCQASMKRCAQGPG